MGTVTEDINKVGVALGESGAKSIDEKMQVVRNTIFMTRVRNLHSQQNEIKMQTVQNIRHLELTFRIDENWIGHQFVQGPTVGFHGVHVSEPLLTDNHGTLAEMMQEVEQLRSC